MEKINLESIFVILRRESWYRSVVGHGDDIVVPDDGDDEEGKGEADAEAEAGTGKRRGGTGLSSSLLPLIVLALLLPIYRLSIRDHH
jgi:hypothetical protein